METSDPGLEGLIRDIMIVATECEFDNDIHLLVDSLNYQDPASYSLDNLMEINDRYGDIVYNLISLREMYNQPIHELIDGPAFPLLLDEDRDPAEIKAALAMVSHTQKDEGNSITPNSTSNCTSSATPKLHPEPTTARPQDAYLPPITTSQSHLHMPAYNAMNAQHTSSPSQHTQPTSSPGEHLLLSSLQEVSARQSAALMGGAYHHGFVGVASTSSWNHSWVVPTDTIAQHKRKRVTNSNSSSSSNDVYIPYSLSKKRTRRLSEPSWYSQMEPTMLSIENIAGGGGGALFYPHSSVGGPHPSSSTPQPQASLEGTPLHDLPGASNRPQHPKTLLQPVDLSYPTPATLLDETSNSSNDEDERGLDFHWLHLKAARERRASRRQRRLMTPRGVGRVYQEELSMGQSSSLDHALGLNWGQVQQALADSRGDPFEVGSGLPLSASINKAYVVPCPLPAAPELNRGLSVSNIHAPPPPPPPCSSSVPCLPPPHPAEWSVPIPVPPAVPIPVPPVPISPHSSADTSNAMLQLVGKDFGFKHAKSRKGSKHNEDDTNEYQGLKLWQFLLHLLLEGKHPSILRWVSRGDGLFRVLDSEGLAQLWGGRRGHMDMNYDKMSRALRYYYNKNLLDKSPKRLHYQFKYYSRWWEKLQAVDPTFKMESIPQPPETKLPEKEIIAMGIVECEGTQLQDCGSPHGSRN